MEKAELLALLSCQIPPITISGREEFKCTDDIGLEELSGTIDGTIHVRLGSEIDDCGWLICVQQSGNQFVIANVPTSEDVQWVVDYHS